MNKFENCVIILLVLIVIVDLWNGYVVKNIVKDFLKELVSLRLKMKDEGDKE